MPETGRLNQYPAFPKIGAVFFFHDFRGAKVGKDRVKKVKILSVHPKMY